MILSKYILASLIYLFLSWMGLVDYFWTGGKHILSSDAANIIVTFVSLFLGEIIVDAMNFTDAGTPKE
jgi:hypothetical protein